MYLLEDTDGAPYPQAVQDLVERWTPMMDAEDEQEFRVGLMDALEAVATQWRGDE